MVRRQKGTGRQFVAACVRRALLSASGKRDPEDGSSLRGAFQQNLSPVILHNLLYDSESKPGAVLLAKTYKRMKQVVTNRFGNAGAVVRDGNRDGVADAFDRD